MSDATGLRAVVAELAAAGVREAIVCPGSRSTPLALALRQAADLRVRVLLDERVAGFVALGMARTSRRPVAILVTSGTAAAELLPAVVEASLSRVPLVVLTADRPPELQDRGAAQTIDQVRLFGRFVRWETDLPLLDGEAVTRDHWRSAASRAVATALGDPAGPVHLNAPFREPLLPDGPLDGPVPDPLPAVVAGRRTLAGSALDEIAGRLAGTRRGLIVAGPDDDPDLPAALAALARATGFPILADPLSGLRTGRHDRDRVIARGDLLTRSGPWIEAHEPDLVLRTGAMPTSKPLVQYLERVRPDLVVLDGGGGWREASILPITMFHADPVSTAHALGERLRPGSPPAEPAWAADWLAADRAASAAMTTWLANLDEPFEGAPFAALATTLPDGATLWAGNSMPVRDLDAWLPSTERAITVRSNRGANGIDGVVSTAVGSAAVTAGPVALVVGDVSFLHDLGALVAAPRLDGSLTVVLVHNDGGGIFSFLPQAQPGVPLAGSGLPEHYEELFGTPHGIDLGPVVTALGATHRRVGPGDLETAIEATVGRPGVHVLELRTDRWRNVQLHREVASVVAAALAPLAGVA